MPALRAHRWVESEGVVSNHFRLAWYIYFAHSLAQSLFQQERLRKFLFQSDTEDWRTLQDLKEMPEHKLLGILGVN